MSAGRVRAPAYAKLNLGLQVTGRRADGYHELVTILHQIDVHDTFVWEPTGERFCYQSPPGVEPVTDLVRRVLDSAPDRSFWTGRLWLEKRIPISAGLGGGSADAAVALRMAHPDALESELLERAAALGSDVPFFVRGGTALATGTGTTLAALPPVERWFVIVVPHVNVPAKTQTMYRRLQLQDFSNGAEVLAVARSIEQASELPQRFPNTFMARLPELTEFTRVIAAFEYAGLTCSLSGAGPSFFAMFPCEGSAGHAAKALEGVGRQVIVAKSNTSINLPSIRRLAAAIRGTILSEQLTHS